jgi:hypothetical protein
MLKVEQYGFIKDGELKILNRKRFDSEIKAFPDCDVQITIKKKGKRSTQQNRYYWGVIVDEIRHELLRRGNRFDAETIHEFLKQKFNSVKVVVETTGELIEMGKSTTEMNKDEFTEYIERIREWAAQSLELNIPDAGTQTNLFAA